MSANARHTSALDCEDAPDLSSSSCVCPSISICVLHVCAHTEKEREGGREVVRERERETERPVVGLGIVVVFLHLVSGSSMQELDSMCRSR